MFKAPDSLSEQIAQHLAEQIISGEMKSWERIQEQKITLSLNVSRGSVREALLMLERRHLVVIPPRRGAHVAELTPHNVKCLYSFIAEQYVLLFDAVLLKWRDESDLRPFRAFKKCLLDTQRDGILPNFVDDAFATLRATYSFANNPYLQETVEDLMPAIRRTFHLSLAVSADEIAYFIESYSALLQGIVERNPQQVRQVLLEYAEHNCQQVLAALAES